MSNRTAAIAADPTHPAAKQAQRLIRQWNGAKAATRAGLVHLLCEPVFNATYKLASVRARAALQSKYDRGID